MKIAYRTEKLEKLLKNERELEKEFGAKVAKAIKMRKALLESVDHLGEVPHTPPEKRHELSGRAKGKFSVYTAANSGVRIVFVPNHDPVPEKDDGGVDLEAVTDILILEITDYH